MGGQAWLYLCFKMSEWFLYSTNTTLIFHSYHYKYTFCYAKQWYYLFYPEQTLWVTLHNRVEGWNFINRFDPTTLMCLFKVCTWIANVICFMDFLCSMISGEMWLFVLLMLVELLTITVWLSFFNDLELSNFYFCPFIIKYLMEKQHISKLSL